MLVLALSLHPVLVILCPRKPGWQVECAITQGQEQASSDPDPNFMFSELSIQSNEKNCKKRRSILEEVLYSAVASHHAHHYLKQGSQGTLNTNAVQMTTVWWTQSSETSSGLYECEEGEEKVLRGRNIIYQFAEREDQLKTVDWATEILTKGQLLGRQIINTAEEFFKI